MSATVLIGLIFALATAMASIVGFLYKHKGAVESPDVEFRRPVRTSIRLFYSRWYSLGIVIALSGWGFHVAALSLAPISLVAICLLTPAPYAFAAPAASHLEGVDLDREFHRIYLTSGSMPVRFLREVFRHHGMLG